MTERRSEGTAAQAPATSSAAHRKDTPMALAAADHPLQARTRDLPEEARCAAVGHMLDFDDLHLPAGAPQRPATDTELAAKFADCGTDVPGLLAEATWDSAAELLRTRLPMGTPA